MWITHPALLMLVRQNRNVLSLAYKKLFLLWVHLKGATPTLFS
jgi:hypothetical protein